MWNLLGWLSLTMFCVELSFSILPLRIFKCFWGFILQIYLQRKCFYTPVPEQYIAGNSGILTFYKVWEYRILFDLIAKFNGENALFLVGYLNL